MNTFPHKDNPADPDDEPLRAIDLPLRCAIVFSTQPLRPDRFFRAVLRILLCACACACAGAGAASLVPGAVAQAPEAGALTHPVNRSAGAPLVSLQTSQQRLQYGLYAERGAPLARNIVPDFSRAGYRGGGVALPARGSIPVRVTLEPGEGGDDAARIQAAIDALAQRQPDGRGLRGVVLLKRGHYTLGKTLVIEAGGIVLRGEGRGADGTVLRSTVQASQGKIIDVGLAEKAMPTAAAEPRRTAIANDYLPVGAMRIAVASAAGYRTGDTIAVAREPNAAWLGPEGIDTARYGWTTSDYAMYYERVVTAVTGNTLSLDAPIVDAIEARFGGGHVYRTAVKRIAHVGIEDLRLEGDPGTGTIYGTPDAGPYAAVRFGGVRDSWVRNVTARFVSHGFTTRHGAHFNTIEDFAYLEPRFGETEGMRRYVFHFEGNTAFNLVQRCFGEGGRHTFVTGIRSPGPNVFLDCLAVNESNDSGPHQRWSTGTLYDNTKGYMLRVQQRRESGSGRAWAGAQQMFWNSQQDLYVVQAPPFAMNWSVGQVGELAPGKFPPEEPAGIIAATGQPVSPRSLYLQQLRDRLGEQAVVNVTTPAQRTGRIWDSLGLESGSTLAAAAPLAARLDRVEHGLRGPVHFQGEPAWSLRERMRHYGVPGVSLAIIQDGHVLAARAYGVADRQAGVMATPRTLFQAASVSKPVTAFGVMRMVERGELALDRPVNAQLHRWKIPENAFTQDSPVTLKQLLSHTAGLTVHGFMGYLNGQPLPGLLEILDGKPPANSAPVRVDQVPGSAWRYSGGGYTVAEVLMADVAKREFVPLMDQQVLTPIAMYDSHFGAPLDAARTAAGVMPDGTDVPGRYKIHPESAAAALWSTPTDLARFLIEVQRALQGNSPLLKASSAETLLREVRDGYALGFGLTQVNGTPWFGHDGWNDGFNTHMVANRAGEGVVVMINANQPELLQEIRRAVAAEFDWPGYSDFTRAPITAAALSTLPGRYRYNDEQFIQIDRVGDGLTFAYGGESPVPLVAVGGDRYVREESDTVLSFPIVDGRPSTMRFSASGGSAGEYRRMSEDERAPRELLYANEHDAALAAYRELAARGGIIGSQDYLNRQGYRLLGQGRPAAAVQVLALVAALYPDSANAWDSLGEGQRAAGDRAAARAAYLRVLAIDPTSAAAIAALKALD